MAGNKTVTKGQAALAVLIALAADGAQLFLNSPIALFFGIGAEAVDIAIDVAAAIVVIGLLGFNPVLLPTFVLEAVPLVDAFPTWTACVAFLLWRRNKQAKLPSS